jgi:hypothetical protein
MKSSLENVATSRVSNAFGSLPLISAHPVREGTNVPWFRPAKLGEDVREERDRQ